MSKVDISATGSATEKNIMDNYVTEKTIVNAKNHYYNNLQ